MLHLYVLQFYGFHPVVHIICGLRFTLQKHTWGQYLPLCWQKRKTSSQAAHASTVDPTKDLGTINIWYIYLYCRCNCTRFLRVCNLASHREGKAHNEDLRNWVRHVVNCLVIYTIHKILGRHFKEKDGISRAVGRNRKAHAVGRYAETNR
jgi:hypothetical protein